jgi:hypothetical protein
MHRAALKLWQYCVTQRYGAIQADPAFYLRRKVVPDQSPFEPIAQ